MTYLSIYALVLGGFAAAIAFGFEVEGTGQSMGILAAAWVGAKITQPLRIAATVVLTPLIARAVRKARG